MCSIYSVGKFEEIWLSQNYRKQDAKHSVLWTICCKRRTLRTKEQECNDSTSSNDGGSVGLTTWYLARNHCNLWPIDPRVSSYLDVRLFVPPYQLPQEDIHLPLLSGGTALQWVYTYTDTIKGVFFSLITLMYVAILHNDHIYSVTKYNSLCHPYSLFFPTHKDTNSRMATKFVNP